MTSQMTIRTGPSRRRSPSRRRVVTTWTRALKAATRICMITPVHSARRDSTLRKPLLRRRRTGKEIINTS